MHSLLLLVALWFPQDQGLQDALNRVRADLNEARETLTQLESRLAELEDQAAIPPPVLPPVDPPVDPPVIDPPPTSGPPDNPGNDPPVTIPGTGNYVRLFAEPPSERFAVRFTGPVPFEGLRAEPLAWGPAGEPTAYLLEATIIPSELPAGELDDWKVPVELLSPAWPVPSRLPAIPLQVWAGGAEVPATDFLTHGKTSSLAGLQVSGWSRQWRPGVFEYELLMQGTSDRYFEQVTLGYPDGTQVYVPDVQNSAGFTLIEDEGLPFVWLAGQSTMRRFLVGRDITPEDERRFERFEQMVKLVGPDSYQGRGGWGVARSKMPLLTEEAVGQDLTWVRHLDGEEDAERYRAHVLDGVSHGEFKYQHGLGPWNPRGERSGGGSGGSEIHPYSAWALTPGESWKAYWQARTMLERMPVSYYANGLPVSKPDWFRPYEKELIKYQPHDTAHMQRAMLSPSASVWGAGGMASAGWLRDLPFRYDAPELYPEQYEGEGHPHAHRADGWAATRLANAYALTPPGPTREHLLGLAEAQADRMLRVMMPSGLTHRSGDIHAGGPFAAWLNPNLWQLGKLPEGTTIARQIMTAINSNGAMALEQSVFGDGRMRPMVVQAAASAYFHELDSGELKTPPPGQVIVGGLQFGELYPETTFGPLDDSVNVWECQWHLVYAYRLSGDVRFLERAAEIMGHDVPLQEIPEAEYSRTGSARAWWSYTPEVVAEIQALK